MPSGTIAELWRDTVKSMGGERIPSTRVGRVGVRADLGRWVELRATSTAACLSHIHETHGTFVGIRATVEAGGEIAVGEAVEVEPPE